MPKFRWSRPILTVWSTLMPSTQRHPDPERLRAVSNRLPPKRRSAHRQQFTRRGNLHRRPLSHPAAAFSASCQCPQNRVRSTEAIRIGRSDVHELLPANLKDWRTMTVRLPHDRRRLRVIGVYASPRYQASETPATIQAAARSGSSPGHDWEATTRAESNKEPSQPGANRPIPPPALCRSPIFDERCRQSRAPSHGINPVRGLRREPAREQRPHGRPFGIAKEEHRGTRQDASAQYVVVRRDPRQRQVEVGRTVQTVAPAGPPGRTATR